MDMVDIAFKPDGSLSDISIMDAGRNLSRRDADQLLLKVLDNEHDICSRILLLRYFWKRGTRSHTWDVSFWQNLNWLIAHHPEFEVIATCNYFDEDLDHFRKLRRLWQRQVRSNPSNLRISQNAAQFCMHLSPRSSQKLLKNALTLEPGNEEWPRLLSHLYFLHLTSGLLGSANNVARRCVAFGLQAIELHQKHPIDSYLEHYFVMTVGQLADLALSHQLLDEADILGNALFRVERKTTAVSTIYGTELEIVLHGDALYAAHTILGKVALVRGRLDSACHHLQQFSKLRIPGTLDLELAQGLLTANQRTVVIECLTHVLQDFQEKIAGLTEDPPRTSSKNRVLLLHAQNKGGSAAGFITSWQNALEQRKTTVQNLVRSVEAGKHPSSNGRRIAFIIVPLRLECPTAAL